MNKQIPPSLEKVTATANRAKQACLSMRQAGEMLEKSLMDLENQVQKLSPPHSSI